MAPQGALIHQGEVRWVGFAGRGSEPWGGRPALVLQHDRFNRSRLNTVVVAAITTNLRYAGMPGNVRLAKGEANLRRASVVNVTQVHAIDRGYLGGRIGELSRAKLRRVWEGVRLLLEVE